MVVNHGLRAEGDTEAATAVQQAEALGFQTVLLQVIFQGREAVYVFPCSSSYAHDPEHALSPAGCLARWTSWEGTHHGSSQADTL